MKHILLVIDDAIVGDIQAEVSLTPGTVVAIGDGQTGYVGRVRQVVFLQVRDDV